MPVAFNSNWTRQELATAVVDAINGSALPVDAVLGRNGIVNLGSRFTLSVDPESSSLALLGQPGTQQPGATPIAFRPTEDIGQLEISELIQMAVEDSNLEGVYTVIDEAGRIRRARSRRCARLRYSIHGGHS